MMFVLFFFAALLAIFVPGLLLVWWLRRRQAPRFDQRSILARLVLEYGLPLKLEKIYGQWRAYGLYLQRHFTLRVVELERPSASPEAGYKLQPGLVVRIKVHGSQKSALQLARLPAGTVGLRQIAGWQELSDDYYLMQRDDSTDKQARAEFEQISAPTHSALGQLTQDAALHLLISPDQEVHLLSKENAIKLCNHDPGLQDCLDLACTIPTDLPADEFLNFLNNMQQSALLLEADLQSSPSAARP